MESTGRCQQRDSTHDFRFHRTREVLEIPLRIDVKAEGLLRHDPNHADLNTDWNVGPFIPFPIVSKLRVPRAQGPSMPELIRDHGLDLADADVSGKEVLTERADEEALGHWPDDADGRTDANLDSASLSL